MHLTEQEITIISLFIGPTIVAAVISGAFSLILSRRSERLKNITEERSKWREKIRQISEDIQTEDVERLRSSLNLLKLHINAYGLEDSTGAKRFEAKYILMDTHIWVLIYQIEHSLSGNEPVGAQCELLRKYLSLLLKYDWERAKGEVNHGIGVIFGWFFMIVSMNCTFIMPLLQYDTRGIVIDGKVIISFILANIIVIVAGLLFERRVRDSLRKNAASEYNGFKNLEGKIKDVYELLRPYVNYEYNNYAFYSALCRCILYLIVNLFLTRIWQEWGIEPYRSNVAYIGFIVIYTLGAIMVARENKKIITNEYSYLVEINRLSSKFYVVDKIITQD